MIAVMGGKRAGDLVSMDSVSAAVRKNSSASARPRCKEAWGGSSKYALMKKCTTLSAMRIYIAVCIVISFLSLLAFVYVFAGSFSTNKLGHILLGPYEEAVEKRSDLGVLGKMMDDAIDVAKKIEVLSAWANNSGCVPGSGLVYRSKCYRLTTYEMTYDGTNQYCSDRQGHVAYFTNEDEWEKILGYLWSIGFNHQNEIWTGLRKDINGTVWRYSNGEVATFVQWAKGNVFDDGFDCAQIRTELNDRAGIYDRRCSDKRLSLCQFAYDK